MFTMPTAPKSIGGVLDDTFQLYRQSFWAVWPLALLGFVLTIVVIGFATLGVLQDVLAGNDPQAVLRVLTSPALWFAVVLTMIVAIWLYAAQLLRAHGVAQGEPLAFGSALGRGLSITPALLLASLLYFLMFILTFLLPFVATALVPGVWLRLLGVLILCIPCVFLAVTFYFYMPAIAVDDAGPLGGLGRSRRLVRGNWWRVTAILTVGFIILMVVYLAAGVVAGLLATPIRDIIINTVVSQIVNGILTSVVAPLFPVLSLAIYYDLRLRKFGGDLAQRVDGLA